MRCPRCGALLFPAEGEDLGCFTCGERVYAFRDAAYDRLIQRLEQSAVAGRRERGKAGKKIP